MRSLKVIILVLIVSVCLWSETSAACAMRWKFLEENYNPTYQVRTPYYAVLFYVFILVDCFSKDDERDNALCAGKPDGFYVIAGQCVPDFYGCVGGSYFALVNIRYCL